MTERRKCWSKYFFDARSRRKLINTTKETLQPGIYYPKNFDIPPNLTRRKHLRAVFKNGNFNIDQNIFSTFKYCSKFIVTLVEMRWRWTLLNFCSAFILVWLLFGIIYWLISLKHGDFIEYHLPQYQNVTNFVPCVKNMYGFTSAFLFSVEVQTTVAYGRRSITLECPDTIIAMCVQCMISSIFQAVMVGILYAKLTRPRARTQTILFSKHAVVNVRNDKFCLIFRVGDIRKSRILNIEPKAYIIRFKTDSAEVEEFEQIELKVDIDECESTFFLWPVTVVHVIDESSPFYSLSAADLLCSNLEILVAFEGIIESTGKSVQARTSYTEYEIMWGHRFIPMVDFNFAIRKYEVDFSKLSEIYRVDIPLCSAREYRFFLDELNV